jgi:hypothetical protein
MAEITRALDVAKHHHLMADKATERVRLLIEKYNYERREAERDTDNGDQRR